jgi:transmembrane sensor
MTRDRAMLEDAARWALRQGEGKGGGKGELRDGPWIGDPTRLALYCDVADTLDDPALDEALAGFRSTAARPAQRAVRRPAPAFAWGAGLAMAAAVVATLAVGLWRAYPADLAPQVYQTARGQVLQVALKDGTRLQLNGDTRLTVQIGARRRQVNLERGQAFFDVAHEATRPFEVRAAASRAVVLGTAFDLDVTRQAVELSVYRGRVRFGALDRPTATLDVDAGRRTVLQGENLEPLERFDAVQDDWRDGWFDSDGVTLGQLAEELNRRSGPLVVVQTPKVAAIRISGRFKLNAPDQLLAALGESYGFRLKRHAGQLLLSSAD